MGHIRVDEFYRPIQVDLPSNCYSKRNIFRNFSTAYFKIVVLNSKVAFYLILFILVCFKDIVQDQFCGNRVTFSVCK